MKQTPTFALQKLYDDLFETDESRREAAKPKVEEIVRLCEARFRRRDERER